jgi:hypothetical protein
MLIAIAMQDIREILDAAAVLENMDNTFYQSSLRSKL